MKLSEGKYHWSKKDIETLQEIFPVTSNQKCAEIFNVSVRTIVRKARELGIEKHPDHRVLYDFREFGRRGSLHPNSIRSRIRPGERRSPGTEFKPGNKSFMSLPLIDRLNHQTNKKYINYE